MRTLPSVLFSIAMVFYVLTVMCVLQLVREVNRGSKQGKVSIWTWHRGWKIHKVLFPGSALRTRLLVCMCVTVGLGLVVFFLGGSGYPQQYEVRTLPSGRVIRVLPEWKQSGPYQPAELMLNYETRLKIANNYALHNDALHEEVDEIWESFFRKDAEQGQFKRAMIIASEAPEGRFVLIPDYYNFTYDQIDGRWVRSEFQKH